MFFARVIGTVWATIKDPHLMNASFEIIQPINARREPLGTPIVAVNTIGAGAGETVMYITASEASIPLPADMAPTDATIVGIVDSIDLDPALLAQLNQHVLLSQQGGQR